ncbi:type I restriction endonuclease subunit R [Pseudoalteromonas sp. SCSIO 43088]|uniref:type I restriction endonuclease subunit R n=1 Tax=Pseudoalteromonas sp. SCSIO 43088 TaxID=2822846 RepID=UPI00202AD23B|nr:type I restriction endonuclease [Pseudoalteromonas sp. SCSIO 43088]URQ86303.1 type I restriction endonuclease subunit R [Pseudoalteromonas sp. SCSIO 43088]
MNGFSPTEKRFEEHIEDHLKKVGYSTTHFSEYDRNLCLIRDHVIDFIKRTQPEEWGRLQEIYDVDTENKILSRISSEISKRGIIDVLRHQVVDRGVYLNLCYFEPKSDLNPDHLKLYQSNQFTVVRQLHYSNQNENSIDMVLFLNGLPIVTMELKNQLTGQNVKHSENQYRNDRDPKEPLLNFKRCMVHFCVDNNKVSMTTRLAGPKTFFLPYNRDLENPPVDQGYRTKYLWEEILPPSSLLDILENFVHVSKEKEFFFNDKTQKIDSKVKELLVFPRYHQLDLIRSFRRQLKEDGVGKNYLVQHTTGSGKSYSIGWLSHTLTSLYRSTGDTKRMFDTIIVVTDRTVLDDQLRNTIRSLEKIDGVVNGVEHGSQELKKFLEQGKDIVITTIQKFPFISETIASLGDRTFGVVIDEVHSSQSGELSKDLKKSLTKSDDDEDFDYEEMLRQEIQSRGKQDNISFFGFTGTPKEKTLELFGTKTNEGTFVPFHIYSMYQSIHEGFTLDVLQNYTTYKRYFKVKQTKDGDIEVPTGKGKRELVRYVDSHEMTIRNKVQIILDHWVDKGSKEIQGRSRGMIVTQSRKHCVWYFNEINRQLEERGLSYRCLVGFSGEVSIDGEKYSEPGCNQTLGHEGDVPLGLKNPKYRLLVVANKFQTGFDEPLVQSMYVDKKLGGVQCVQTLSRLNRTTSGKTQTFTLDFVNEPEDIRESFQRFYQSTILEGETDPNRLYDIQRDIYNYHLYTNEDVNRFCEVFYDLKRDEGNLHPTLDSVLDKFISIEDEDVKEDFRSKIQSYIRMYGYLSQIMNFTDIELEKSFVFLKYLNKKLPKRDVERFDISDTIDLDSLRIQKIHEQIVESLKNETTIIDPPDFGSGSVIEPEFDLLSEIINQVNTTYGVNLTEEDRLDLSRLSKRLIDDPEVGKYMNGNNTEDNKRNFFKQQFEGMMIDYINERFDFYKKMDDNPSMKNLIFQTMYKDYQTQHSKI